MHLLRQLTIATGVLASLAVAASPVAASAAAPWGEPLTIPGATGGPLQSLFTAAGHGVVVSSTGSSPALTHSQVAEVTPAGAVTRTTPLDFVAGPLAAYGRDRIVVAGRSVARSGPYTGTVDDSSSVVVRFGTPAALGAERVVAGTKGQQLYALSTNRGGLMALVTGTAGTRTVFVRRPGSSTFTAKLRMKVSDRARGTTVAAGERGDILVVYEDAHTVRARHIGTHGNVGPVHRLGPGVQSNLQAVVNDDGRLEVAWESQRVNEGETNSPATVWFITAAPGHGFGAPRRIATVGKTGIEGRAVSPPGVRLVPAGDDALLAYTDFDGSNYRVAASQVVAGHVGAAQRLSPAGQDAVLGDAAVGAKGAQVVAWRSGVAGGDPSILPGGQPAHTPVLANVRAAGAAGFGAAEAVSPADVDVPAPPSAAIDTVSDAAIVAFSRLTPSIVEVAARSAAP
jgi:hypothetical protein